MHKHVAAIYLLGLALVASPVFAQRYEDPRRGPDQPVRPRTPRLERRDAQPPPARQPARPPAERQAAQPRKPRPPFVLTRRQQAQVNHVLNSWEQRNRKIKTFDCRFKRWIYDVVEWEYGPPDQPLKPESIELGVIKYAAPDRGLFRVEAAEIDGEEKPIDDNRAECWICDGESIFEYKYTTDPKQLIEHKLPPELHGKAIADSPLPFLFSSEAEKLKQRYFIRIVTPRDVKGQIWLEAYPRYQQDAANFHHAHFIISEEGMTPFALRIVQPNGKNYTVYQFYDIVVNDPLKFFHGNPFRPFTPLGWRKIVKEPPPAQARRARPPNGRR